MMYWYLLAQSIEGPVPEVTPGVSQLEIAAVVGALLIIARVIVKFTVTKKDDLFVEKVAGWLKVLRVITGLNIKKGVDKYNH